MQRIVSFFPKSKKIGISRLIVIFSDVALVIFAYFIFREAIPKESTLTENDGFLSMGILHGLCGLHHAHFDAP